MADIPRAVLSEQFEALLDGRRLVAAVFVTFRFDPEFFEQQVLPVFVKVATSHADGIRRVQLEDALKDVEHRIAVYYDQNGLDADAKPARQDISRVPVIHKRGIFHPKNVFALMESVPSSDDEVPVRSLLVSAMSANLTRAGWWENVEVCHIETIGHGETTRLKDDLYRFLDGLERKAGNKAGDGHDSLSAIKNFLKSTEQRQARSGAGTLHPHFFDGTMPVSDFLWNAAGGALRGLNLEVISPYFDEGPESKPLAALIEAFDPPEIRIYLPKKETGEALCSDGLYKWVRSQPSVSWARLPKDVTRGGKSDDARSRTVHAKVYRFFQEIPKKEFLFVGSVNLTNPAHQRGNVESGFLVELEPPRRPDWWLELDRTAVTTFAPRDEDEGAATTAGSRLSLRYRWDSKSVEAYWDHNDPSPPLRISRSGVPLFPIDPVRPREWVTLDPSCAATTEEALNSTSIFMVEGDRPEPAALLVQEEGMAQRPSVLFELSPAEILRYWSLLTSGQRAAFLEAHAPEALLTGLGADLMTKYKRLVEHDGFFDRFAGTFISFAQLERTVRESLVGGKDRAAEYRLFGKKYDSLGRLLAKIQEEERKDPSAVVEHYVMVLCARQMVNEIKKDFPDFFRAHSDQAKELEGHLAIASDLRGRLNDGTMDEFLDWFDDWFLERAAPVEEAVET